MTTAETPQTHTLATLSLAGRRVWSTAHISLVPTPTPTVGDKCLCGHSVYIMPL